MFKKFRIKGRDIFLVCSGTVVGGAGVVLMATGAGALPGAFLTKWGIAATATGAAPIIAAVGATMTGVAVGNTVTENVATSKTREERNTLRTTVESNQVQLRANEAQIAGLSAVNAGQQNQLESVTTKLAEAEKVIAHQAVEMAKKPSIVPSISPEDLSHSDSEENDNDDDDNLQHSPRFKF